MSDIELMKAEIERHIKHYEKLDRDEFKNGELYICQELLSFIDSLQQEQSSLPDNLDEEAHNWAMKDSVVYISRKKSFKAGAEWMAKQMKQIPNLN